MEWLIVLAVVVFIAWRMNRHDKRLLDPAYRREQDAKRSHRSHGGIDDSSSRHNP